MNSEERNMISGLFDRMRSFGAPEKDRDAEALIAQSVRAMPDAPYMLVQSVLVQEHALQQAGQRIEELEARVAQLEANGGRAAQASGRRLPWRLVRRWPIDAISASASAALELRAASASCEPVGPWLAAAACASGRGRWRLHEDSDGDGSWRCRRHDPR